MSRLTTIASGGASHVTEPRRAIARTGEEWRALWAVHAGPGAAPPAVEFDRLTIAAAFAGDKPSAGHTIEITDAGPAGSATVIRLGIEEHSPDPGTASAAIIMSPFHMVSVPKSLDVAWIEEREARIEERVSSASNLDSSTGLQPNTASALAYLAGPFSGVLVLMAESTNNDVRFHAWQSIVGLGGLGIALMASYVLAVIAVFVSATVASLMFAVGYVIWIVIALVWLICLWKAWAGGRWKLPLVGEYAEKFT